MTRRTWKRRSPISLQNALEMCVHAARDRRNHSVERIADLMGLASHYTLYKWIESGRMPVVMIRPFEQACGEIFVTQHLAHSAGRLVVDMPRGRKSRPRQLSELSAYTHTVLGLLVDFYDGQAGTDDTLDGLTGLMTDLAAHRSNVQTYEQPQLSLEV